MSDNPAPIRSSLLAISIAQAIKARYNVDQEAFAQDPCTSYVSEEELAKVIDPLLALTKNVLIEAENHLDYTGYGDSWERSCAKASKLPERIGTAIQFLTPPVS